MAQALGARRATRADAGALSADVGRAGERARRRESPQAGRAGRLAHARGLCAPGCAAGPTGCALGALSLF